MYQFLKRFLFMLNPERAHGLAEYFLRYIATLPIIQDILAYKYIVVDKSLDNEILGLRFYNPVGLAAGFDKDAVMIKGLSLLGFSHLELGTITFHAQNGNDKPRLFRHIKERSLQNAMGFNNAGAQKIGRNIAKSYPYVIPLGINVGKNKIINQNDALKNYKDVLEHFTSNDLGDYFVFNVSSPNTQNLRDLANVKFIKELFATARKLSNKPMFLKVSPDMEIKSMLEVIDAALQSGANGIIATNTSIDYTLLANPKQFGGVSGKAIKEKSQKVFYEIAKKYYGKTILIAVGGISTAEDAYSRIKMGASVVQIYTSLIYNGLSAVKDINEGIIELLKNDGYTHISQAIGADFRYKKEDSKKVKKSPKKETKKIESKRQKKLKKDEK